MLTKNKDGFWYGNSPVKLNLSNWGSNATGGFECRVLVRSRQNINNEQFQESFLQVINDLNHLADSILIHPIFLVQLAFLHCRAQLIFTHEKIPNTFILSGFLYERIMPSFKKILNGENDNMKPASKFRGKALRGLWHKHIEDSSLSGMAKNIQMEMKNGNWLIDAMKQRIQEQDASPLVVDEAGFIAHLAVISGLRRRNARSGMTGEWVVFEKNDDVILFLTLGAHQESDQDILERIQLSDLKIEIKHKGPIEGCKNRHFPY